jgi:hypothetical protein
MRLVFAHTRALALALVLPSSWLVGCGGAPAPRASSPSAVAEDGSGSRGSSPSSSTPALEGDVHASVVRFDDLGIVFPVPPGYRVIGDEELSSRLRASADLRLNRSLRDRAAQKKGLPLLTLEKETSDPDDFLTLSLAVVVVPSDARATELIAHEESVMAEHLAGFHVTEPAKAKSLGGIDGAEITTRYQVKRGGEARRASSNLRLYVREGLATIEAAVWPEGSEARGEEARLVLDGLGFYEPNASGSANGSANANAPAGAGSVTPAR